MRWIKRTFYDNDRRTEWNSRTHGGTRVTGWGEDHDDFNFEAAAHMMPWFAFTIERAIWSRYHEHAGDFKEPWMPCFADGLPCSFFDGCSLYGARNRLQDAV